VCNWCGGPDSTPILDEPNLVPYPVPSSGTGRYFPRSTGTRDFLSVCTYSFVYPHRLPPPPNLTPSPSGRPFVADELTGPTPNHPPSPSLWGSNPNFFLEPSTYIPSPPSFQGPNPFSPNLSPPYIDFPTSGPHQENLPPNTPLSARRGVPPPPPAIWLQVRPNLITFHANQCFRSTPHICYATTPPQSLTSSYITPKPLFKPLGPCFEST